MKKNNLEFDISNFSKLHSVAKNLSNIISSRSIEIPIDPLLEKIFVGRPYFAFDKIYQFEDVLIAPVNYEQPIVFESTPMSSAEASRHLAILGSCAVAMNQENRQYYLAVKARKKVSDDVVQKNISKSSQLFVLAAPLFCNEKEAAAVTILTNSEGDIIFDFTVGYQIFSDKLFERVFKAHAKPTKQIDYSPYQKVPQFKDIEIKENVMTAILPTMKIEQCAGHFDNFPILPVGVLAYMAINTIGHFLNNITQNSGFKYHLLSAEMDVLSPTSIDEESELVLNYHEDEDNKYNFSWTMYSLPARKVLNTMNISFSDDEEAFDKIANENKLIEERDQSLELDQ